MESDHHEDGIFILSFLLSRMDLYISWNQQRENHTYSKKFVLNFAFKKREKVIIFYSTPVGKMQ